MTETDFNPRCSFCKLPVIRDDDTWYEITGWVKGQKKDSLSLRALTGLVAHPQCIDKAKQGVHPDDQAMDFGD